MREDYKKGGKSKKDPRLERAGVSGYNKPKKTPNHPTKSHVVVAKEGDKVKTIRFGQQGVSGSPKKTGESSSYRKRRESFKAHMPVTSRRVRCQRLTGLIRLSGSYLTLRISIRSAATTF